MCRQQTLTPETDALNLALVNRKSSIMASEERANICSTCDRPEHDILLDIVVHPAEEFRFKWRAGRQDLFESGELVVLFWFIAF